MSLPDGRPCTSPSLLHPQSQPQSPLPVKQGFLRKLLARSASTRSTKSSASSVSADQRLAPEPISSPGLIKRMSKRVVPGLPRTQTFKRQLSEDRKHLAPVEPSAEERRAASVDRRAHYPRKPSGRVSKTHVDPHSSAPSFFGELLHETTSNYAQSLPIDLAEFEAADASSDIPHAETDDSDIDGHEDDDADDEYATQDAASIADTCSMTTSQYEAMILDKLEREWILNLSMHFRDRSKREKFFVTYREEEHIWRRVTISLDYRDAPENSLEWDLSRTKYQRDKSTKIYEAIRDSLQDIQFYDSVTNLKLETTDGRLHVHVVEDGNEIIHYPTVSQIRHLGCKRVKERDIVFDSHMSGFVYKVSVMGKMLIKKEIPSPDTVEEFLYEVNALSGLRFSKHVIDFYGVVVDDDDEQVKGLLISFAGQGALIDIIFENCKENNIGLPWSTREKWARQIVQGLADVHESGFVQGDFTLSNIVIDDAGDAKIIDINRRGCPVGWEPPEATALIESNQRLSMYIGVKSDLYQLGMVLWGLAMLEDEPETQGRPLILGPEINVPDWYRQMTEICLSDDPRMRLQASSLLRMFPRAVPDDEHSDALRSDHDPVRVDNGAVNNEYLSDGYDVESHSAMRTADLDEELAYPSSTYLHSGPLPYDQYYTSRGRSPPSPLPSDMGGGEVAYKSAWAANKNIAPSYSDSGDSYVIPDSEYDVRRQPTPTPSAERFLNISDRRSRPLNQLSTYESTEYFTATDDAASRSGHGLSVPMAPESSWGGSAANDVFEDADATLEPRDADEENYFANTIPAVIVTESPVSAVARPRSIVSLDEMLEREIDGEEDAGRQDSAIDIDFEAQEATIIPDVNIEAPRLSPRLKLSKNTANIKVKRLRKASPRSPSSHATRQQTDAADTLISTDATASSRVDDGAGLRVTTPETESEPDYIASRSPGFKSPDPRQSYNASGAQRAGQLLNAGGTSERWVSPSEETLGQTEPTGGFTYPRHGTIPVSLTGIGAAHLELEGDLLQEKGLIDDEFQLMTRPEAATPLMITTDAQT
ncbi:serine/threonine protein kinase [Trichoderma gamsii]|uniref:Serine/threonine protein kinase n=1 Tax=Trichoderma gamsii TaxID=398673 RepID=A0A2P4ZDT4_9HYPO|nr:serine/threonine protein kinase [Trichoderma gamsii]PON22437.1 serine/threonine protein kinase [Trichoderma gamsii]